MILIHQITSILQAKEDVIITKWNDGLLKEAPKPIVHTNTNLAMNSNTTKLQDAKEQYDIERRKSNVVILEACKRMNLRMHYLL